MILKFWILPFLMIYLDFNATTPLAPEAKAAIIDAMDLYGNPSSGHALGKAAKDNYETARSRIASLINADANEMTILSCGTESINYCLRGSALASQAAGHGNHIITSAVEHDAVLEVVRFLVDSHGFEASFVPVDEFGMVSVESVVAAVTPNTVLVSIMHSNNEVGTINPIAEIAEALKGVTRAEGQPGVVFHSDTSQSLGKVKIDAKALGVDYLTVTGHKLYAPKGIGALYSRKQQQQQQESSTTTASSSSTLPPPPPPPPLQPPLVKLMYGAGHENGKRAGTENTLLAAGLGAACAVAETSLEETNTRLLTMRNRLQRNLEARFPPIPPPSYSPSSLPPSSSSSSSSSEQDGAAAAAAGVSDGTSTSTSSDNEGLMRVNGHPTARLPNTLSVSFKGVLAPQILAKVEHRVLCSAGAACHSHDDQRISHVLRAMQLPLEFARGTLRLSVGKPTTEAEVDEAAELIADAVESLLVVEQGS